MQLFEDIFQERVRTSPELATSLGLDKGPQRRAQVEARHPARRRSRGRGPGAQPPSHRRGSRRSVPATLSDAAKLNREVVIYSLRDRDHRARRAGTSTAPSGPIRSSSRAAPISTRPTSSTRAHTIDNASRRRGLSVAPRASSRPTLDNDTAEQRAQAARGFLAPGWSIDLTLGQMRKLRDAGARAEARWSNSIVKRTAREGHRRRLAGARRQASSPSQRLSRARPPDRAMEQLRPTTPAGRRRVAPAQRRRDLRRRAARRRRPPISRPTKSTRWASPRSPRSAAELDTILKSQGYTQGTRRRAARPRSTSDPSQLYPDTDAGRAELLAEPQRRREGHVRAGCRRPSRRCPAQPLEIRRVPPEIQDGASNGYYRRASLDGSRPGDLLHQPQGHRRLAEIFAADAHLSRGRSRPSPADQHRPGIEGHSDAAQARLLLGLFAKAGRSTPSSSPTSSASIATTRSAAPAILQSLPVPRRAAGGRHRPPRQALEPRAGDRLHGRDHRLRARRARSARSSATAPRSARRAATRSATPPGSAPATKRRRRSGDSSTSSSSTRCCKEGAMPLSILERRIRERTAALAGGRASRTERG